jgi:hypothetical protein
MKLAYEVADLAPPNVGMDVWDKSVEKEWVFLKT